MVFQPQSIGRTTGQLAVADEYRTQTISLSGTGLAPPGVSLSPINTLNFPATGVGQTALPQTVTLTNNGGLPLQLESTKLTGDFAIVAGSDTCGATLAPANACTLQVVFTPTAGGARSGALTITDSAPNSPQILRLTGTAIDFALSPDGDTTVTVASGQNAVFPLLFTPSATMHGTATFTCAGAPLNAACNVTPANISLDTTATVSVVVLTGVPETSFSESKSNSKAIPSGQHRHGFWLAALLPLSLVHLPPQAVAAPVMPRTVVLSSLPHRLWSRTPASLRLIRFDARTTSGHPCRNLFHRRFGHQRRVDSHDQSHPHRSVMAWLNSSSGAGS